MIKMRYAVLLLILILFFTNVAYSDAENRTAIPIQKMTIVDEMGEEVYVIEGRLAPAKLENNEGYDIRVVDEYEAVIAREQFEFDPGKEYTVTIESLDPCQCEHEYHFASKQVITRKAD